MSENSNNNFSENVRKQIRRRFTAVMLLFFLLLIVIFCRIIKIQFVEGSAWRALAKKQKKENVEVLPNRGNILSRDGQLMASTIPVYALYMDFQAVDQDTFFHYLNPLCRQLSRKLGDRSVYGYRQYLLKGYEKHSREYVLTKRKVTHSELREIQKFPLFIKGRFQSGLYEKKYYKREKPFGSLASRTIGDIYGEFSRGGKNGLELEYNSILMGTPGLCARQKVAGKYISVVTKEPKDGTDLLTTIDVRMQDIAETALRKELSRINAKSGSVVLMDVKTGEILAMTNLAAADSGVYVESQNFAVADKSEPGSTFKIFSMIVALEDKMLRPTDSVNTGNGIRYMYGRKMEDHNANHGGYHIITAAKSIWVSSNIGVSYLIDKAYRSNPSRFVNGLYRIGLNKPMSIEIPGAARPYIPYPKDKRRYWAKTDLPWMSIGYVTQMPPIYTLAYYNAIANNGVLMKPYLVKEFQQNGETIKKFQPTILNPKICSDATLNIIHGMLDSVVTCGTGAGVKSKVVKIAGKTGTAQISKGASGYQQGGVTYQVSFCGYFPANNPRYSCIVVVREPKKEPPAGGKQAGGVFKEIAERITALNTFLIPVRADTAKRDLPNLKSGNYILTRNLINSLNLGNCISAGEIPSGWIIPGRKGNAIELAIMKKYLNLVPDVKNMGARDAVYLLGSMGLKVRIAGKGKVVEQSLIPGALYTRGETIILRLE